MATNILYVDDNQDTLLYIQFMLQRRGYQVDTALGGKQAIQKARENMPDLFLVDVLMPDMDGFQLTEAIRADPTLGNLPIILFSAATTAEHQAHGFNVGADDYLTKPILNDELDNRIQAALKRTEIRRVTVVEAPPEPPPRRLGRVIGFWGCKGGVGVTSLTVNTAIALAQESEVIVGDLNVGMGSIVLQMKLQVSVVPQSPWTMRLEEITPEVIGNALIRYSNTLAVLLMSEGEHWSPSVPVVETVLEQMRQWADWILLDLGSGVTADKNPLLLCCDHIVLVSGADRVASALAEYALEAASNLKIARDGVSVVMIQRRDTTGVLTPEVLERNLRLKLDAVIPIAQTEALWAFERGTPVATTLPKSRLGQSYLRFSTRLREKLSAERPGD